MPNMALIDCCLKSRDKYSMYNQYNNMYEGMG